MRHFYVIAASMWLVLPGSRSAAQDIFSLRPSFRVASVYDDNLFFSPHAPVQDFITRISPALDLNMDSPRLSLFARYGFDAEIFNDHPELTTVQARRAANLTARYRSTQRLTLVASGDYFYTLTPAELSALTRLQIGRTPAYQIALGTAAEYRASPLTWLIAEYAFMRESLIEGVTGERHSAALSVDREITPRSRFTITGLARRYTFDGRFTQVVPVVTVGFRRQLTESAHVLLRGGPRFSNLPQTRVSPEVWAELGMRFQRGEVTAVYVRSQDTSVGRAVALDTEQAAITLSLEWPSGFRLRAAPSVLRSGVERSEATVYLLSVDMLTPLTSWFGLVVSGQTGLQQGGLEALGGQIRRNVIAVGLVVDPALTRDPSKRRGPPRRPGDPPEESQATDRMREKRQKAPSGEPQER